MRGADKLLQNVQGQPLLRHVAQMALGAGLPVVVTLASNRPARVAALDGLMIERVELATGNDGMGASLRAGVLAIPPHHAVAVLLADMPDLDQEDLARLIAAFRAEPDHIHRGCTADGTVGHPVVFPTWARDDLLQLLGDTGAKAVLKTHEGDIRLVPLPACHATTDLDTPEDWARWRAGAT
jgi:CTP:molybdopterin cytidylyltransferase MocA